MKKGLIVSIQGYSQQTTQELSEKAISGGAEGIRTDQNIKCSVPIIGLKKLYQKKYYMTSDTGAINDVMKWADFVALDCRKGNTELDLIISHCHVNNFKYIADIETIEDYNNLIKICDTMKIIKPVYIGTTFNVFNNDSHEKLVKRLSLLTDNIIVEGGISQTNEVYFYSRHKNVSNICIGTAISDIYQNTQKFSKEYACY